MICIGDDASMMFFVGVESNGDRLTVSSAVDRLSLVAIAGDRCGLSLFGPLFRSIGAKY